MNTSYTPRLGSQTGKSDAYRPEIDGLRAVAVLAVILGHFDSAVLPNGHLGVDVFFVISGFVISSSLYSRQDPTFSALLGNFYVRRLKRLLPALIACVVITGLLIGLFDPTPASSLKTGVAALFGLSNVFLFLEATDYFGKPAQLNVFTQTWSLGVEEQFYILFPLILWLTGLAKTGALRRFSIAIATLSAVSLAAFLVLSNTNEAAAFFLMPARFWELGVGCLAFAMAQHGCNAIERLRKHANPTVLIITLCAVFVVPNDFSMAATVAAALVTALLILAVEPGTLAYGVLSRRSVVYIGQISYSLYLWHWSVLSLSRWTVGVDWTLAPFQATLMFVLAAASYRYLEKPLRFARWGTASAHTFAYGGAASVAAAVLLVALGTVFKGHLYTGQPPKMVAKGISTLREPYRNPERNLHWVGTPCVISSNKDVGKVIPIDGCTLGDFENATRRVLVVGNSFSAAFVHGFDDLVTKNGYAVTITSFWNLIPARNSPTQSAARAYYWNQAVPALLARLKPGDALVLIQNLDVSLPKVPTYESRASLDDLRDSLERLSGDMRGRNIDVHVLHGLPFTREAGCEPDMAAPQWFSPFGRPCRYHTRADSLARRAPLDQMLSSLSSQGKIKVIDLFDVFCPGAICSYVAADGQLLYRDSQSHPSVEAVLLSAPTLREALLETSRQ